MFPASSLHALRAAAASERRDRIRLYREVEDPDAADPYATKGEVLYDGACSVTESATRIRQASEGDAAFDADVMVRLPLIEPFDVQGVRAEVTYGGIDAAERITREAALDEIERGRVERRLFLTWQTHGA